MIDGSGIDCELLPKLVIKAHLLFREVISFSIFDIATKDSSILIPLTM